MAPKVLICDNEAVLRALVRAALRDKDYELVEATDGDESIALIRSERPDVVLLDMMMPGRSGIDVLREVRADPELAETAVVVLTARTQAADREAVAAADHFVAKPFSPLELAALVEQLLEAGHA